MTPGKLENLKKLSTRKGIIAAAAMDQRGSLVKSIAKEKGIDPAGVTPAMMAEFRARTAPLVDAYLKRVPQGGLFVSLGVTPDNIDWKTAASNHSPLFVGDDKALPIGVRVMSNLALEYLKSGRVP